MKKLFYIIPLLAIMAIVIIKLRSNKKETEGKVYTYDKEQPILVTADTVRQQLLSGTIQYTGTFEPFREAPPPPPMRNGEITDIQPGDELMSVADLYWRRRAV